MGWEGARQEKRRYKPSFTTTFDSILDGVMFHHGEGDQAAMLKWKGRAWVWFPEGYREGHRVDQWQRVEVLTPRTVVDVIRAGDVPGVPGSLSQS